MALDTQGLFLSPAFKALGRFDRVSFGGLTEGGRPFYDTLQGEAEGRLFTAFFLSAEDAEVWKAFLDVLDHALKTAAASLLGFFGFQMIACELSVGIQHFDWGRLPQLLVNHGRAMVVGETRLIQFGALFGLFHKRMPESWGRIERKFVVEIYRRENAQLDLYLKQLLRDASPKGLENLPLNVVAFDLSTKPVLDPANQEQAQRLEKWCWEDLAKGPSVPSVRMIHSGKEIFVNSVT